MATYHKTSKEKDVVILTRLSVWVAVESPSGTFGADEKWLEILLELPHKIPLESCHLLKK